MPTFLVKHPERGELTFKLTGDRVTVGRRADNTVQINHGTISGHHAELVSINGHYVLRDLDSTNHCFVDGFQISEADLNDRCKVLIGGIECEYIPDAEQAPLARLADPSSQGGLGENTDSLRKLVGALRHQNDELIQKLNEQQNQIDILGSARLLTPATGADLQSLRLQVKTLTAERDELAKENRNLLAEVDRLRALAALKETGALKATVPIPLPEDPDGPKTVSASGSTTVAAPMAKVVDPIISTFAALTGLSGRIPALLKRLADQPGDKNTREELSNISGQLAERAAEVGSHTAARLIASLDALVRDVARRPVPVSPRIRSAMEQASDLLGRVLSPEVLARCATLPAPGVLVVEDDKELLPAILASLEYARLEVSGTGNAEDALATINSNGCDLVLLDIGLPGVNGLDLCSHIRSLPKHERTPIVFLTGHDGPENRGQSTLNGGSDFIAKPFNMFELTLKAHTWAVKNQLGLA
jgi:CheY-like chemotaxis protein